MGFYRGPNIVTDGLVLVLDAGNIKSYISGSSIVRDLTGTTVTGSLFNGTGYASSSNGNFVFDGVDDYIRTIRSDPTYPFSISTWFTPASVHDGYVAGYARSTSTSPQFGIVVGSAIFNNSKIILLAENLGGQQTASSATVYQPDSYYNAVGVFSSSVDRKLYINGVYEASSTSSVTIDSAIDRFSLGRFDRSSPSFVYFSGKIANVTLYNRALSPQEIEQNYEALKGRFGLD